MKTTYQRFVHIGIPRNDNRAVAEAMGRTPDRPATARGRLEAALGRAVSDAEWAAFCQDDAEGAA